MKKGCFWIVCLCVLILVVATYQIPEASAEKIKVVFLNPQTAEDTFWKPVTDFMQAACDDLGMELKVYTADFSYPEMLRQAREALNGAEKPDFLVFKNFRQQGYRVLEIAQADGVQTFMFNAGLLEENQKKYGGPREHFTTWIGQMLPDDELAGYDLAQILIAEARKKSLIGSDGKIHALGISGPVADTPAILRNQGFERAVQEHPDVILHQTIPSEWSQEEAKERFPLLYRRHPDITIGWGANDPIALGIAEAVREMGKTPGQDVVTGGIDWTGEALKAIEKGDLTTTIGGHFMEGGWVMVLLYDYANGIDFASESVAMTSRMSALTAENLNAYLANFGDQDWGKIDFKQFSKKENPNVIQYDFSVNAILKQFE